MCADAGAVTPALFDIARRMKMTSKKLADAKADAHVAAIKAAKGPVPFTNPAFLRLLPGAR